MIMPIEGRRPLHILLVEDDPDRVGYIRGWAPDDVRLNLAASAGQAIGALRRDRGRTYAGVMLDHDLQQSALTTADLSLSGSDLIEAIIRSLHRDTPILVHSMNPSRAEGMARRLDSAGFWVSRIPFSELTRDRWLAWIAEVRDLAED